MPLFQPLTLRSGVVLPNRMALAPLTNQQSHADGLLSDDELNFLARRAEGGFGTIETCATYVALDGKAWPGELGIDRDECLPGLTRLAQRLRTNGAISLVQLFHGGVRAEPSLTGEQTWSASSWDEPANPAFNKPRAGTIEDIQRTIRKFAEAAARAERAGFDGVELHGAHGYLLSQFLSRTMNTRTDEWGGDNAGRAKLIREVMRACRAATSKKFAIGVRLSLEDFGQAKGMDLDDNLQVAKWLVEDGADFIHASLWDVNRNTTKRPEQHPLPLLREALPKDIAIFAAGKVTTRAVAEATLAKGADVVSLGRAAIIDPDWPKLVASEGTLSTTPMPAAELVARAVSPTFVEYLRKFKNFVADV